MRRVRLLFVTILLAGALLAVQSPAHATKYGAGSYGRCQYDSCSISLTSGGSVSVDVLPSGSGTRCSVAQNTVTVTTSSSTGYSLSLIDSDATTMMTSGSQTIAAVSGTLNNPAVLSAGTWGYRVDSAGFGAGPTGALTSGPVPTLTFAGIQPNSGTADRIVNSSGAATGGAATNVWYGLCAGASQPSGTYADSVTYTALVN